MAGRDRKRSGAHLGGFVTRFKFWHTTGNGIPYPGDKRESTGDSVRAYKAALRKAYGSLRGVTCYRVTGERFRPGFLCYLPSQLSAEQRATFKRV